MNELYSWCTQEQVERGGPGVGLAGQDQPSSRPAADYLAAAKAAIEAVHRRECAAPPIRQAQGALPLAGGRMRAGGRP